MTYKAVFFDLDGTLVNSLEDLADSANAMLASFGLPERSLAEYRYFVGNGAKKLMERCLPEEQGREQEFVAKALRRYNDCYTERLLNKTKPYPEILDLLRKLKAMGLVLAVCTNKQQFAAEIIVRELFMPGTFAQVVGDSPGEPKKPDPAGALRLVQTLGLRPEEIAFLGDSSVDMELAKRAGFLPVGVAWGFRPRTELLASGAKVLLEAPLKLISALS